MGASILGSLYLDRVLGLPALLPGRPGSVVGLLLLVPGGVLWGWCVARFLKARGTPAPINPPRELVTGGPYAWSRNPMMTGMFACFFGLGFLLHSVFLVLVTTPLFMIVIAIQLKRVEEPELERRFGEAYRAYKARVPMFLPRPRRRKKAGRRHP